MSFDFFKRWRATREASHQLDVLLAQADPAASVQACNAWLVELGYWLRRPSAPRAQASEDAARQAAAAATPQTPAAPPDGQPADAAKGSPTATVANTSTTAATTPANVNTPNTTGHATSPTPGHKFSEHTRLRYLVQVLDRNPDLAERFGGVMRKILKHNDARSLFADTGLATRPAFWGELMSRVQDRLVPLTPHQTELSVVFVLFFIGHSDADWVQTLDDAVVAGLIRHIQHGSDAASTPEPELQAALADSIVLLCNQIAARALDSGIRQRLDQPQEDSRIFMLLPSLAHQLMYAEESLKTRVQLLNQLRATLTQSHAAIDRVYTHLEHNGVSVDVIFQVERTRVRIHRVEDLLAVWADSRSLGIYTALVSDLIRASIKRRSIRALVEENYAMLGRKVVERSAETGEHYIARTRTDYLSMLKMAAGGGVVTAFTVYLKFFITALHLAKFAEGLLLSMNYVGSFLTIHFAHFTLATKQPAMTAPALAKKLEGVSQPEGRAAFVEESVALIRSQVAAIAGNLALVFPVVLLMQYLLAHWLGSTVPDPEKAHATIASFSLLGMTPLYAAFTGVLLWLSSLAAGWGDNWFALHQVHGAIAHHRRLHWMFGPARTLRLADFMQRNIAGIVANGSLGLMLGLVPAWFSFVGLPIDVRHVTLSTGSVAAAIGVLGFSTFHSAEVWWAFAGIASMAVLNLAVSFSLAFSMALRSRNLDKSMRSELRGAVLRYFFRHPLQAFFPPKV